MRAVSGRMETIKNTPFAQIEANYDRVSFASAGLNGIGISYVDVDDADSRLLKVTIPFCFRLPNGRVIGEDKDLDAALDAGEDLDGNGRLDSVTEIET